MLDYKQAAAGEREDQELSQNSERSSNENRLNGYLSTKDLTTVILALQAISARQLTPAEEPFWMERLSKYPRWQLSRLINEYSGPFNDKVIAFLDALKYVEPSFKSLPSPEPTDLQKQIAKDFGILIKKIRDFKGTSEERLKFEWDSHKELDRKYPNLNHLAQIEHEKRFQGIK